MTGFSLFGILSRALGDLFKSGTEAAGKHEARTMTPDELLRASPDNFMISYEEIVSVTLVHAPEILTRIAILTGDDKFEFSTPRKYAVVEGLFKDTLAAKLTTQRV